MMAAVCYYLVRLDLNVRNPHFELRSIGLLIRISLYKYRSVIRCIIILEEQISEYLVNSLTASLKYRDSHIGILMAQVRGYLHLVPPL